MRRRSRWCSRSNRTLRTPSPFELTVKSCNQNLKIFCGKRDSGSGSSRRRTVARRVNAAKLRRVGMSSTTAPPNIGISAMSSRLLEYLSDPEVSLATIVNVISTDASLSKKLQDAANSVAFGQGRFSNDLRTAIAMLGCNQVTSLAVCFSLHNESLLKRDRS